MSNLFQGSPQAATSYSTSSSQLPQWMQDAVYNQVQMARNVAAAPFSAPAPQAAPLSAQQKQAIKNIQANQGAWKPELEAAQKGMEGITTQSTAGALQTAQQPYLQPQLAGQNLQAGQGYFGQAGEQDIVGAASPYLQQAGQSSVANINQYMNPYQEGVLNTIAERGARNLTENLLPGVSDAFIKAGGFGGSRMGEFGSRALRDTQEAILNQQAQAAQQGYTQALGASSADLTRQANLASTVGSLTGEQMQNLAALGQLQTAAGGAQQAVGLGAAQGVQGASAGDISRQQSAFGGMGDLAAREQGLLAADASGLMGAGEAVRNQQQQALNAQYQHGMAQNAYPQQQLDWLSNQLRGMAPLTGGITTNSGGSSGASYSASPLSQLASGLYAYKGMQNMFA